MMISTGLSHRLLQVYWDRTQYILYYIIYMSEYTSQARGRLYSESGASTMFSHKGTSQICLGRAARARVARTDVYGKAVS